MFKRKSILSTLLLLNCLSTSAWAVGYLPENNPCGELHWAGAAKATIDNKSNYPWNVVFTTHSTDLGYFSINAGAVKYLNNGWWLDVGEGNSSMKTYKIPVPANSSVDIAYCTSYSGGDYVIRGNVAFETSIAYVPGSNVPGHGLPVNGVAFYGYYGYDYGYELSDRMPRFDNHGMTAHVDYNRKYGGADMEYGSLTICPVDPWCITPY
jgi:hypothetical protein